MHEAYFIDIQGVLPKKTNNHCVLWQPVQIKFKPLKGSNESQPLTLDHWLYSNTIKLYIRLYIERIDVTV